MPTKVTLPNEEFLRKEFVEAKVFELLEPQLYFLDFLPKVQADAKAVKYKYESTSAATDTKKKYPRKHTAGAKFAMVSISDLTVGSAILSKEGFEVRIDEDAQQYPEGVDEIDRAFRRVAYYLAESVNSKILAAITSGVNTTTNHFNPSVEWSDPNAQPINDLIGLAQDMRREGYPYRLTDVYLHTNEYWDLVRYLTFLDVGNDKQKAVFGIPNISESVITVPVLGNVKVHELLSSMETKDILGFDQRFPCGTFYYAKNPKYPMTVENELGFHVHSYEDNETHDLVYQFWIDFAVAVKEPYAAIYNDGSKGKPI